MNKLFIVILFGIILLTGCTAIVEDYKQRRDAPEIARQKRQLAYTAKLKSMRHRFKLRGLINSFDEPKNLSKAIDSIQKGSMHYGDYFQLEWSYRRVFQSIGNNRYLADNPGGYSLRNGKPSIIITLTTDIICFEGNNLSSCLHPSKILRYDGIGTYTTAIGASKQTLYFTAIK